MEIYCTRPGCSHPQNFFADLDDNNQLKTVQQKYCTTCGMPLILDGRYIPLKLLGRGGFGAAFLARDRRTPGMRQCVVKQFQPAGNLSPEQLQIAQNLFEREGEVLEQLGTHPQIPDLYAFFEISGNPKPFFYLVQEFIDGKTLEEELAQKGKFSEAEVLEVLREILKALKFVHENGAIHRDIKPSNIIRHRNGLLYLLDFGAVKQITTGAIAGKSGKSTGIYSMGFAPPEQMAGGQVYPSTDLYALAITCIQLLTGKDPNELFDGYSNQLNWRGEAEISDRLAAILERMLLAAPNQRFQSAQEVWDAIAIDSTPAPVLPPSIPPPPQQQQITLPPASPSPITPNPQPLVKPQSRFSLLEVLTGAAFAGFEGGLLFIVFNGLLLSPSIKFGLLGMILGGLIFAQYSRFIEGKDLPILAVITLGLAFFLRGSTPIDLFFIIPILLGAGAVAAMALFRLIYKLIRLIFFK